MLVFYSHFRLLLLANSSRFARNSGFKFRFRSCYLAWRTNKKSPCVRRSFSCIHKILMRVYIIKASSFASKAINIL